MLSNLRARIPFTPRNALALGLHLGLGSLPLLLAPVAAAQQQVQRYDIPAGQLGDVLSSFARQAGVAISFDASQVAGRRSTGLQGSYGVNEGLAVLLGGQGLQAQGSADGFVLVSVPGNDGALELGVTTINSQLPGSTTEGTGSYITGITNAATKLNLSLRETPQSVSVMTRQRMEDQNLRSIGQVLEQTSGVNVQSPGSDRLYVFSRGLAIDSYQYDGMPTTTFAFSQALPQALSDMAIYDRVEVVRGATGLLTGAGDPSGTVNLVRKKPTDHFKGYISGGLGSWDLYRTEVDVSGPLTDNGGARPCRGGVPAGQQFHRPPAAAEDHRIWRQRDGPDAGYPVYPGRGVPGQRPAWFLHHRLAGCGHRWLGAWFPVPHAALVQRCQPR